MSLFGSNRSHVQLVGGYKVCEIYTVTEEISVVCLLTNEFVYWLNKKFKLTLILFFFVKDIHNTSVKFEVKEYGEDGF